MQTTHPMASPEFREGGKDEQDTQKYIKQINCRDADELAQVFTPHPSVN